MARPLRHQRRRPPLARTFVGGSQIMTAAELNAKFGMAAICRTLGSTAAEVAGNLELIGIKGKRKDPEACPLAQFLTTCGFFAVNVDATFINWTDHEGRKAMMTPWLHDFVVAIDNGNYPALTGN